MARLLAVKSSKGWNSMAHEDSNVLPDLHSEVPNICIPVHSVGHVGVKRIVAIDEHDSAAMVVMDISVGLYAHQRGAHMSRLIECADRIGPQPTVLDYAQGIFERRRGARRRVLVGGRAGHHRVAARRRVQADRGDLQDRGGRADRG
ncbi:GTP cyclohydrolase, FolE2/MptA family, partial [Mycobacterium sp.]|uniref:GTP cyclohydrolase, FolE2/MptA family n=1 Tax=Mycobacterium sp. TaxID=1785 RepID=UPI003F971591